MKINQIKNWSSEKISQRVFYLLIGLAVLVFALFFLVGYDMPFEENPDFNAPLFTNVLILLMYLLLVLAFVLAIVSIVKDYRNNAKVTNDLNEQAEHKISRVTWLGTVVLLVLTFCVGSSTPILVNGSEYNDWSWLKLSDMLVYSSIVMLIVAIIAVLFGATRYIRKGK